jgi:hypothetical protein
MLGEIVLKSSRIVMIVVVGVLSVSACSGDKSPAAKKSPNKSPSASAGVISPKLPDMPKFDGKSTGVVKDLVVKTCDTESGTVTASGTIKNSGKEAKDLAVVMNWAVTTGGDVVARAVATVKGVEPGATEDWKVETKLSAKDTVQCVPTALRGTLS